MPSKIQSLLLVLATIFACFQISSASKNETYITYEEDDGTTVYLAENRRPALYTGNFGDCLGGSLINVSRFDAAYYHDNLTVNFHLAGSSALANESLMMYIGVYAYGENRFELTFDPCNANIKRYGHPASSETYACANHPQSLSGQ